MATLTVTTTPAQDRGMQHALIAVNTERAAQTPPLAPLTARQYAEGIITQMLDSWAEQADDSERTTIREAYRNATPAKRAEIKAALGV